MDECAGDCVDEYVGGCLDECMGDYAVGVWVIVTMSIWVTV